MRLFIVLLFLSGYFFSPAQPSTAYDFQPLSPTASELGKYGLIPRNLATGAMSTDVPLYTLKTNKLSIPISLMYSSSGVKVNDISGHAGMNWVLNAGGAIVVIIRDEADEDFGSQGGEIPYPSNTTTMNVELARYLESARLENFDSERDLYSFNFLGKTGKFVFDRKNTPLFVPYQAMQFGFDVELVTNDQGYKYSKRQLVLTDEAGIKYYFGTTESSLQLHNTCDLHEVINLTEATAYFLNKIEHPEGDQVVFEYEFYNYHYYYGVTQQFTEQVNDNASAFSCAVCPPVNEQFCWRGSYINAVRLTRIRTFGYGDVAFHYSTREDIQGEYKLDRVEYLSPSDEVLNSWQLGYTYSESNTMYLNYPTQTQAVMKRLFLTSVKQVGAADEKGPSYSYEYNDINGMAPRLSFSQDHWGFFNGKRNTYLVPKEEGQQQRSVTGQILFEGIGGNRKPDSYYAAKGMLKTITYPTGSKSEIYYEGNTYEGSAVIPGESTAHSHSIQGLRIKERQQLIVQIDVVESQDVEISFGASLSPGYSEADLDGHQFAEFAVSVSGWEPFRVQIGSTVRHNKFFSAGHHEITISAWGEATTASVHYSVPETEDQVVSANIPTGGVRVSKIVTNVPETGQNNLRKYHYASFNNLNISSGKSFPIKPLYYQKSANWYKCPGTTTKLTCVDNPNTYWCDYLSLTSTSQTNLNYMGGNNIVYSSVVVTDDETFANGYEEHTFLVDSDYPGRIVLGEDIIGAPLSNFGWKNALLKSVKYFKNEGNGNFKLISSTENEYHKDDRVSGSIKNMVVKVKYNDPCALNITETCTSETVNYKKEFYTCTVDHNHRFRQLLTGALLAGWGWQCLGGNRGNYYTWYHGCYGKAVGTEIFYEYKLTNLDVLEYEDFLHWYYLKSTKKTEFQPNGESLVTEVQYVYDNPVHLQPSAEISTSSKGNTVTIRNTYPADYNETVLPELVNKNIVAVPVKKEELIDNKIINGELLLRTSNGAVTEVRKYENNALSDAPPHNPDALIPDNYATRNRIQYDAASGRPNEIHYPDGKVASLIWGYGRRYLIAQVTNKSFAELSAILGDDLSVLESSTDNAFINTKIGMLRNALPGTPIVSFNYKPGIGVISQTDQNGLSTYYAYDVFGRLKFVKDDKGNVKKKFDYHYKAAR